MAGKKKQNKDGWIADIEGYSRQIWLAGLGAYAKVGKEGVKLFENLIKDGEAAEKTAKAEIDKQIDSVKGKAGKGKKDSVEATRSKVDKAKGKVTDRWAELEDAFDKRLNNAVSRLGVPSRDEVKALNAKVDELTKLMTQMAAGQTPAAKAAPRGTAKPSPAKPAVAKPATAKAASKTAAKPAAGDPAASQTSAKPATPAKPKAPAKPRAATKPRSAAKPKAPAAPKAAPAAPKVDAGADASASKAAEVTAQPGSAADKVSAPE